ncbi:MAG: YaiI/YqxD family protein [Deltaproteobacteria bacterium]|jgi:uncharacterized protein YaiI (UPF0178 family)|nr:YaiI/YqxD family protein [Deltaproteobacteria bacterium]
MQIWVDADACPRVIKEILYRAADRVKVMLTFVANMPLRVPRSRYIDTIHVAAGFDVADDQIVKLVEQGDLVVTADLPLADKVVKKGGYGLDPRGELYTEDNIGQRLAIRNLMDEIRSTGMETGGPASFSPRDRQAFANQLDRFLSRYAGS